MWPHGKVSTGNELVNPQKLLGFTLLQHTKCSKCKIVNICWKNVEKAHSLIITTECQWLSIEQVMYKFVS